MRNLLRFLIRYHTIILFLILEIIAIVLITRFNSFQQARIYKFRQHLQGGFDRRSSSFRSVFNLAKENKALSEENTRLYNQLPLSYFNPVPGNFTDTSLNKKYVFSGAHVINNSTNKQYNFLIIDKGKKHGVEPEMAVICKDGIVGIVKETTANFSSVISVLNREFFPNAMIKKNGYFGPIEWPGRHYRKVTLREIPLHANVKVGDTIVTSGYSAVFPPGLLIGTVIDFKPEEGIYYNISVKLSTDFKNLKDVTLVKNLMRDEQRKLEESTVND
jgi:rod shape-determining protein MreC